MLFFLIYKNQNSLAFHLAVCQPNGYRDPIKGAPPPYGGGISFSFLLNETIRPNQPTTTALVSSSRRIFRV